MVELMFAKSNTSLEKNCYIFDLITLCSKSNLQVVFLSCSNDKDSMNLTKFLSAGHHIF